MQSVQPFGPLADRSPLIPTTAAARHGKQLRPVCRNNGCYDPDLLRPGHALDHHPLRSSILADGELTAREAERVVWDVIVVGTGMGGGMLRDSWPAQAAGTVRRKGAIGRPEPGTIRGDCPNWLSHFRPVPQRRLRRLGPGRMHNRRNRRHQRALPEAVRAVHRQRHRRSSALYGMVRERSSGREFTPRQSSTDPGDSIAPEAWPTSDDQMVPWYAEAEKRLGVRGQPDPRARSCRVGCPPRRLFRRTTRRWPTIWQVGVRTYHLPTACDYTDDCASCQACLCDWRAKRRGPQRRPAGRRRARRGPRPDVGSCASRPTAPGPASDCQRRSDMRL